MQFLQSISRMLLECQVNYPEKESLVSARFSFSSNILRFVHFSISLSQIWSHGNILAKRFLDEIILDLFSFAKTEKSKKNWNHDLPKCYPELRFEIYELLAKCRKRTGGRIGFFRYRKFRDLYILLPEQVKKSKDFWDWVRSIRSKDFLKNEILDFEVIFFYFFQKWGWLRFSSIPRDFES